MRDIIRFFMTVVVVLFSAGLIWVLLYFYGQNRGVSEYQTPLVESLLQKAPVEIEKWDPQKKATEHIFIHIFHSDEKWLADSKPQAIELGPLLDRFPNSTFVIDLQLTRTSNARSLKELLNQSERWKRVIFTSPSDGTLRDLRQLNPQWSFTTGSIFGTRISSLASLGLESLLEIPGDVFVINPKSITEPDKIKRLIKEAKRQNKLVFFGPVSSPLKEFSVDGWLLD